MVVAGKVCLPTISVLYGTSWRAGRRLLKPLRLQIEGDPEKLLQASREE